MRKFCLFFFLTLFICLVINWIILSGVNMKNKIVVLTVGLIIASFLYSFEMPVINEVMYDPVGADTGKEWIEIYNPSMYPYSLHNWKIQTAGATFRTDFIFPDIIIQPGEYIVVGEYDVEFADFIADLDLQNGGSATDGVRLESADGLYTDTLLYDFPNLNMLPDDVNNPATEFVSPAPAGYTLARKPNGYDSNRISDWAICAYPSPKSANFIYYDLAISDLIILFDDDIHILRIVIHDLSTGNVDKYLINLRLIHNGKTICNYTPNLFFDNGLADFEFEIDLTLNAINTIFAEISYPHDVDNSNNTQELSFWYGLTPLIINELQFQPLQLEPEWIEFFNRSGETLVLENAFIRDAAGGRAYFTAEIEANDFLVICQNKEMFLNIHSFVDVDKVIETNTWAILNNASEIVELFFAEGVKVDSVAYTGQASMRGKSLERVNPWSDELVQWSYSIAELGSTPLARNSQTPPETEVIISDVRIISHDSMLEHMIYLDNTGLTESVSVDLLMFYKAESDDEYAYLNEVNLDINNEEVFSFFSDKPLSKGYHFYQYKISYEKVNDFFVKSFLNQNPPAVVNEIMFNPNTGEPEWVEFIKIREFLPEAGLKFFADNDSIHIPKWDGEFALITANTADSIFMRENYDIPKEVPIFKGLRTLNNSGEVFLLKDYDDNVYELFNYTSSFSLRKGVSAERISPVLVSDEQNWTASLKTSTPGRRNSVQMIVMPAKSSFEIENNPFSPYRGERCILKIMLSQQKVKADLKVFDLKGREIKNIANKTVISGEYAFVWDGLDNNNRKVIPGIYPVTVSIQDLKGKTIYEKKSLIYVGH